MSIGASEKMHKFAFYVLFCRTSIAIKSQIIRIIIVQKRKEPVKRSQEGSWGGKKLKAHKSTHMLMNWSAGRWIDRRHAMGGAKLVSALVVGGQNESGRDGVRRWGGRALNFDWLMAGSEDAQGREEGVRPGQPRWVVDFCRYFRIGGNCFHHSH